MAGIDNNTLLYLRGDNFNDLSLNSKAIINNGVEVVEGGLFGKRLYFNQKYIDVPITFGTNDFTLEFFFEIKSRTATSTPSRLFSTGAYTDTSAYTCQLTNGVNEINFFIGFTGSNSAYNILANYEELNKTYHFALVRNGNDFYMFLDGVQKGTFTFNHNSTPTKLRLGGNLTNTTESFTGYMENIRISDVARYTSDFMPPTKTFNSIYINVTNKDNNKIDFSISKLGQETINKIEVLVNDKLSKTYDSIGNLTYNIDKSLCSIGNNEITIKVTYDNNYTEEKILNHTITVDNLPVTSSFKDTMDRYEMLDNNIQTINNQLAGILTNKNISIEASDYKLSSLIDKVNEISPPKEEDKIQSPLWLYNAGNEYTDITGGWKAHQYDSSFTNGYCAKRATYLEYGDNGGNFGYGGFVTTKGIDLTNYSKLVVKHQLVSTNSGTSPYESRVDVCMSQSSSPNIRNNNITILTFIDKTATTVQTTVDISNYKGVYYLGVDGRSGYSGHHTVIGRLHSMSLEA